MILLNSILNSGFFLNNWFISIPILVLDIALNVFQLSMESSDEEGEIVPNCVKNYHFVNNKEEPISFTTLPIRWSPNESFVDAEKSLVQAEKYVFLLASVDDDGLQKVYKRVVAWRFDLSFVQPEIYVLSKDMNWIVLQKPRKSFENVVRPILVTVHWLHFLKKNPVTSRKFVWNYLLKAFRSANYMVYDIFYAPFDLFL